MMKVTELQPKTWRKPSQITFFEYRKTELLHYYNRDTDLWTLSETSQVSRYQKGKTRKVKPIWIYWSKK